MFTKLSTVAIVVVYKIVYNSVDMNSKSPISFRLSDKELEVLERERQEHESINQVAARLLRERLGLTTGNNEETKTLEALISEIIFSQLKIVESNFKEETFKLNVKLTEIEARLPKPRAKRTN
jgi:hypothetical protein